MSKALPLFLTLVLVLAGCGGSGGDGDGNGSPETDPLAATCTSQGPNLRVEASDNEFDTNCLAAPANSEVKIELVNEDTFAHNLSIYEEKGGASIFIGPYVQGMETQTYTVGAQPAGRAYFVCDIHPHMEGVFVFE